MQVSLYESVMIRNHNQNTGFKGKGLPENIYTFNIFADGNYSKLITCFPQSCNLQVCSGSSGHTEAVQMLFNPDLVCFSFFNKHPPPCFWDFFKAYLVVKIVVNIFQVTYKELLMVLFDRMDPTTLNR